MRPIVAYFDEAGFTGDNLLDKAQPFFSYAGVSFADENDARIIRDSISVKYNIKADELKGSVLVKRESRHTAVLEIIDRLVERTKIVYHHKVFALAGKIFEYTFEPVIAVNSRAVYNSRFHRFIQYHLYDRFTESEMSAEQLFGAFQAYVRGEQDSLFGLFGTTNTADLDSRTSLILQFITKFREVIRAEIDGSGTDKWVLDLTTTSLHGLLGEFAGDKANPIVAICDESKPIMAVSDMYSAFVNDRRVVWQTLEGVRHRLNFNLAEPLRLRSSRLEPGLQLADVIASATNYALKYQSGEFCRAILDKLRECVVWKSSVNPLDSLDSFPPKAKIIFRRFLERLVTDGNSENIPRLIADMRDQYVDNCEGNAI